MSLVRANMASIADGPSRMWSLASVADALATVDTDDYFNAMADELQVGDGIIVLPAAGTCGVIVVVSIIDGAVVTG